jgi:nitrogen fixation/metabolism regulation signal transduction histidine kinase
MPSSSEKTAMDTERDEIGGIVAALSVTPWRSVLSGVEAAVAWLLKAPPGHRQVGPLVDALSTLADHDKWEVRRALAKAAGDIGHPSFEPALRRLCLDDNARVSEAARQAVQRRRDWQAASAYGRDHQATINAALDDIEVRLGARARDAARRTGEQIAGIFARELYHEMVKVIGPVAASAERLADAVETSGTPQSVIEAESAAIRRRVAHLSAVLESMRAYAVQPKLAFERENISDLLREAVASLRDAGRDGALLPREIPIRSDHIAEVCRPRLLQALTNLLVNAVEAYDGLEGRGPIEVRVEVIDGRAEISLQDFGCGMSDENAATAHVLFATNKPTGTGFGLSLAKKIIESEHAGRLTLTSEKGAGTCVHVALPLSRTRLL